MAQAEGPAQAQVQTPVHPIHEETAVHERLTKLVSETPDNDPHEGTDLEEPKEAPKEEPKVEAKEEAKEEEEAKEGVALEIDEDTPFFDLEYNGEKQKLTAKQIREGYLAKQDYHRNIQKVKAEQAEIPQKLQQAQLQAQQEYLHRLELNKQLVLKTVAPELQNVDLNKLAQEDPAEAQRLFFRQIQLTQTLQAIEAEQKSALTKQQEMARAAFEQQKVKTRETLEKDIKGWNQELYGKMLKGVADEYDFKNEEVEPVLDARWLKVMHDAFQYRQLQRAKPEIEKKVVSVPKVVRPGSAQSSNASTEVQELAAKLAKTGRGEDFVALQLAKQKQQKRK